MHQALSSEAGSIGLRDFRGPVLTSSSQTAGCCLGGTFRRCPPCLAHKDTELEGWDEAEADLLFALFHSLAQA